MFIKTLTKITIEILIAIAVVSIMFYIFAQGFKGMEKTECLKWEKQKEKYQDWYPANWQIQQCSFYSIDL